jgi:hypothetical protein
MEGGCRYCHASGSDGSSEEVTSRIWGIEKCLGDSRRSLIWHPDAIYFLRISRSEFFNSHVWVLKKACRKRMLSWSRVLQLRELLRGEVATMS